MLRKVLVICVMACAASGPAESQIPKIEYTLSIPQPQTHLFQIEVDIRGIDEPEIDLSMPVWSTGYYQILDFPGRVMQFEALGEREATLKWKKVDKNTWRVRTDETGSVRAKYVVYGRAPSELQLFVNARTGHILGSSLFVFNEGREDLPVSLKMNLPEGWKVSNGALPVEGDATLLDDKEAVQQSERYRRYREQVRRGDVVLMATQESDPALHLIGLDWTAWQITRNGYLL